MCALVVAGCGSRCKDVASARTALLSRAAATDRGADVRVTLPFAQIDAVFADLLRAKPLTVPLELPDLGAVELDVREALTATASEVRLEPGRDNAIRFATRIVLRDGDRELTTLAAEIDVAPVLQRTPTGAELVVAFGPKDLVSVRPVLGDDAKQKLGDAVARRLPDRLRNNIPKLLLDEAAAKLASHLTGGAFEALRRTLFERLGELTAWRVKLPTVPIASHAIRSTDAALVVEILTDLRVRRGLAPATTRDVALSGSAAAELANWALDRGYLPRRYDRGLTPRADGEYAPRFDYLAADDHPFKVFVFQERGGCEYFRVGVRASVGMTGEQLQATALDRTLEASEANPALAAAATIKYFLFGWIDVDKQLVAKTQLSLGGRPLATRVTSAALDHDELRFGLAFAVP